jgi:hypothetical protein
MANASRRRWRSINMAIAGIYNAATLEHPGGEGWL